MPKLKPGTLIPSPQEDAAINTGISSDPDTRLLSREWFKSARPASDFFETNTYHSLLEIKKRRGRPSSESGKQFIGLRVDTDVLHAFKATGKGWQTRMNAALRRYLSEHPLQEK